MSTKEEEIAILEGEIRIFKARMKTALMPNRLKGEYDMMIDRLQVLLKELGVTFDIDAPPKEKELNNEKTDTVLPADVSNVLSTTRKLPSRYTTSEGSEPNKVTFPDVPGVSPFQDSPERI